jgi:hypothetical protein
VTYSKPNTSPEYRADAGECLDRAQRALEVAEVNLDTVSDLFNLNKPRVSFADLVAHAEARTRLGQAWTDLAVRKALPADLRMVVTAPDGETNVIEIDGVEVASANHDEHGWSGMDAVVRTALAVANAAGLTVKDAR